MLKRYLWLNLTVILLVTSGILATAPVVRAQTPTIFIDPDYVSGDLTPTPGSLTQWKVNVSDIAFPGMVGHEFYLALDQQTFTEFEPITNGNFTTNASGWTPTVTVTRGTATYGYNSSDGNPSPGSGPGSYRMRANAPASVGGASITYLLAQTFNWTVGAPPDGGALLSFAYTISGNNFGSVSVGIRVIKPDSTISTLITTRTYTSARPWSYNFTTAPAAAFTQKGTYRFELRSQLITANIGTNNYVEIKWDDVGLTLAPISVSEGPFLTSDPRNVGKTFWTAKYMRFPTNVSLYVADSLIGEPWTAIWPVLGGGMIANFTLRVNYGAANLDLWGTKLLEPGLVPPYTPIPMSHTAIDAYFNNRIVGDIAGPENPPGSELYPCDGRVNASDIAYFGMVLGTDDLAADFTGPEDPPGSENYPPDGIVDARDLMGIGKNYGRHYP
ncbi:MAG TPA: hypothetical protein VJ249_10570 [Candidatus Bathyarchaeia archaeon]|nr:hypothetical protein [Candidatus Bathyarchaeia archaeon]